MISVDSVSQREMKMFALLVRKVDIVEHVIEHNDFVTICVATYEKCFFYKKFVSRKEYTLNYETRYWSCDGEKIRCVKAITRLDDLVMSVI